MSYGYVQHNPWQLYSSVKGWKRAQGELTRAMRAALKGKRKGSVEDAVKAFQEWYNVATTLAHFGACDSEPRWEAQARIEERLDVRL